MQFFLTQRPVEALQATQRWSTLYPDDTNALNMLFVLNNIFGETDEAIAALRRINELDPQANRQLEIGDLLRSQGLYDEALAEYQAYIDLFPEKKSGYERIALTHRAKDDLEQELAVRRQALLIAPDDPANQANLGETMLRLGNFDEALAQYRKALESSRTPMERFGVLQKMTVFFSVRGEYTHLFATRNQLWENASAFTPAQVITQKALFAFVYADAGRFDEAEERVAVAKAQPSYKAGGLAALDVDIAWCLMRIIQEKPEGVAETFERVEADIAAYGIKAPTIHLFRGLIYQKLERYAEAAEAYQMFIDGVPDNEAGWVLLGTVQYEMGQLDEARKNLEQGLKLFPSYPGGHLGLAKIANDQQR